jgi:Crp-like helix-turn-helix domain
VDLLVSPGRQWNTQSFIRRGATAHIAVSKTPTTRTPSSGLCTSGRRHRLIRYNRGKPTILDRRGAEAAARACHATANKLCARVPQCARDFMRVRVLARQAAVRFTQARGWTNMLGVRREGVTEAAGKLQKLGVIEYSRGQITVLDRPRLEQLCCDGKRRAVYHLNQAAGFFRTSVR